MNKLPEIEKVIEKAYFDRLSFLPKRFSHYVDKLEGFSKIQGMYLGAYLFDLDHNITAHCLIEHLNHHIRLYKNKYVNQLPFDIYFNFVLDMRINSEELSCAQPYFYNLLKKYMKKDLYDTVVELNYWAYSEVHYGPTDGRTRNSMETYRAGIGRCGEQSTFMVDIFRSLGIPARQIYVPWWTHSDDRHAWVEVYLDDQWYYLGACEPEPVLNKAWFDFASTLAGLVHTHVFSELYDSNQLATKTNNQYKSINVTNHYAATRKLRLYNDIEGINRFDLCLFNYGSLNVLTTRLFENNYCEIEVGQGDFFIRAIKDKQIYLVKVEQNQKNVKLTEEALLQDSFITNQKMGLNQERVMRNISKEKLNNHKEKIENAQRKYEQKMFKVHENSTKSFQSVSNNLGIKQAALIFENLSKKDQEDIDPNLVISTYLHVSDEVGHYPDDVFYKYLVNNRISIEVLENNVKILDGFSVMGSHNFEKALAVHKYVEDNIVDDEQFSIPYSIRPLSFIYQNKKGNAHEKEFLKVALLRYLKVPSKINEVDGTMQYYDRSLHGFTSTDKCYKVELITDNEIVKINSSKHLFAGEIKENTIELTEGLYEFSTTKRYPDLSQDIKYIPIYIDRDLKLDMRLKTDNILDKLSNIPVENALEQSKLSYGDGIYMILDVNQEPSVHIVTELLNKKALLNRYEVPIMIVNKTKNELHPLIVKLSENLNHVILKNNDIENEDLLMRSVFAEPNEYPFIMYVFKGMCMYKNSGYQVGLIDNDWNETLFETYLYKE